MQQTLKLAPFLPVPLLSSPVPLLSSIGLYPVEPYKQSRGQILGHNEALAKAPLADLLGPQGDAGGLIPLLVQEGLGVVACNSSNINLQPSTAHSLSSRGKSRAFFLPPSTL
jgi:hypothetical protein